MNNPRQIPGCLPKGYTLDSLLTVAQFAEWQQAPVATIRKKLPVTPGVIRRTREDIRVHPRTFLEKSLR